MGFNLEEFSEKCLCERKSGGSQENLREPGDGKASAWKTQQGC
jgi:hypothetical protein